MAGADTRQNWPPELTASTLIASLQPAAAAGRGHLTGGKAVGDAVLDLMDVGLDEGWEVAGEGARDEPARDGGFEDKEDTGLGTSASGWHVILFVTE